MKTNTRRTRLAALLASSVTLAGVIAVTSSPASAYGVAQTDEVKIRSLGFDFGDDTFDGDKPTGNATIEWETGWWGNRPKVSGTVHLKSVSGQCARIKVVTFDGNGVRNTPNATSDEECATSNGHFSRTVEVYGEEGAAEVKVVLQSRNNSAGSPWGKVNAKRFAFGPELRTDDVLIKKPEIKFGDGGFDGNAPAEPGSLTWLVDGYEPYVNLRGELMFRRADDLCGRMRIKLMSSQYGVQSDIHGAETCMTDDGEHTVGINLGSVAQASTYVDKVKVIIQRRPNGGTWENAGTRTYYLP